MTAQELQKLFAQPGNEGRPRITPAQAAAMNPQQNQSNIKPAPVGPFYKDIVVIGTVAGTVLVIAGLIYYLKN